MKKSLFLGVLLAGTVHTAALAAPLVLQDSSIFTNAFGTGFIQGPFAGTTSVSQSAGGAIGGEIDLVISATIDSGVWGSSAFNQRTTAYGVSLGSDIFGRSSYTASAYLQYDGVDGSGARAFGDGVGLDVDLTAMGSQILFNGLEASSLSTAFPNRETAFFVTIVDETGADATVIELLPRYMLNPRTRGPERYDIGFDLQAFLDDNAAIDLTAIDVVEFGLSELDILPQSGFLQGFSIAGNVATTGDPFVIPGNGTGGSGGSGGQTGSGTGGSGGSGTDTGGSGTGGSTGNGGGQTGSGDVTEVSEPASALLFGMGLIGAGLMRRRQR